MGGRLKQVTPYALVIALAAYFYWLTYSFDYVARVGQLGPGFWPRAVLGLAVAASVYEIVKRLFFGWSEPEIGVESEALAPAKRSYNGLLIAGMALTVAYVAFINVLGFVLCTLIYLAAFMVLGRYRRPWVIAANSVIGTLVLALVFMKLVYVSLPLGTGVFQTITLAFLSLLRIR